MPGRYPELRRATFTDINVVGIDWPAAQSGASWLDDFTEWGYRLPVDANGDPYYYLDATGAGSESAANAARATEINQLADGGLGAIAITWYPTEFGVGVMTGTQLLTSGDIPDQGRIWSNGFGRYFNQPAVKSRLKHCLILQSSWVARSSSGVFTWAHEALFYEYFAELMADSQYLRSPDGRPIVYLFDSSAANAHFYDDAMTHMIDLDQAVYDRIGVVPHYYDVTNFVTIQTNFDAGSRPSPAPAGEPWLRGIAAYGPAGTNPGLGHLPWINQAFTTQQLWTITTYKRGMPITPGADGRARGNGIWVDRPTYSQWELHVYSALKFVAARRYWCPDSIVTMYHAGSEYAEGGDIRPTAQTQSVAGFSALGPYLDAIAAVKSESLPATWINRIHANNISNDNNVSVLLDYKRLIVTRSGTWTLVTNLSDAGGAYQWEHVTNATADDFIEFTLPARCTGFELFGPQGPGGGVLGTSNVTVDGGAPTLIDQAAGTLARGQSLFSVTGLDPADSHSLRVTTVTGAAIEEARASMER
jgi:hypothetical protein